MKKFFVHLFCCFIPLRKLRRKIRNYFLQGEEPQKFFHFNTPEEGALFFRVNLSHVLRSFQLAQAYHKETFAGYKDKYYGKDVVLAATGPSIKYADYSRISKDAIWVGVNRSFLNENIRLDYLFIQDKASEHYEIDQYKGNNVKKFYGLLPYRLFYQNLRPIPEDNLKNAGAKRFVLEELLNSRFALNIEIEPLGDFQSVVFSAMQFILYTHPERIFLLGCDCSLNGHFYGGEQSLWVGPVIENWKRLKHFAQTYYPDTRIISINPVGLKGVFEEQ
jgi:hypothetical protein